MSDLHTRRCFLHHGLTVLSAAATVPAFLSATADALNNPAGSPLTQKAAGRGDSRILVVVQLGGGNDGFATVVPLDNDPYRRARPRLAITAKTLSLGHHANVALHPNLTAFKTIFDGGHLAVLQGVGYPNPNRSHFRSTAIWETAEPAKIGTTGWLGRYFDAQCAGAQPISPEAAVNIGPLAPETLRGRQFAPVSFENTQSYRWTGAGNAPAGNPLLQTFKEVNGITGPAAPHAAAGNDTLDFLERTALDAQLSSDTIRHATAGYHAGVTYPATPFGRSLRQVASMIAGGLPTRVYYVTLGGFDTHVQEKQRHDQLMQALSDGIGAFSRDLQRQGNFDRTLVMTFSEFGRRVAENASGGTDHGTAAPMFVFGGAVKGGLYGKQPSLDPADLDHGDLRFHTDFRGVYATILARHLGADAAKVLSGRFAALGFV